MGIYRALRNGRRTSLCACDLRGLVLERLVMCKMTRSMARLGQPFRQEKSKCGRTSTYCIVTEIELTALNSRVEPTVELLRSVFHS